MKVDTVAVANSEPGAGGEAANEEELKKATVGEPDIAKHENTKLLAFVF
jgi:hypothetical protein